jgi:hypothetical protein
MARYVDEILPPGGEGRQWISTSASPLAFRNAITAR